ncbi:hypothetical protein SERLA73DRAFT_130166 [Serpula lacrymans var. lacrymans S7.3]|uniref:Uncharacterized protein n=2 Tax=Serpula lacrymans var. lacrymans TaxID=341189 RepID=F8PIT0_SERL3|nr:uncharacterized protein SERLADRAFT_378650 [Serpula lacrymans var. lacrymans S7.9]EGO03713.1 hypothetical protein SERLA73DRAFT_130166 [Serpula lacrymans var. lacrymans S7.3]EGO29577.1 hypothetical protein SERLADRAFT_378650 [Serpula lacrymans var. lacrymans S7.9]
MHKPESLDAALKTVTAVASLRNVRRSEVTVLTASKSASQKYCWEFENLTEANTVLQNCLYNDNLPAK